MEPKIKVSKLDAAKRQLETAVRLYFNDADPIAIHTLAGASHTILSDLNKKYGGAPMIVSDFLIKDEKKKEIRTVINKAKNHFKHADTDPEATVDFNPEVNEFFLFDACEKYQEITSEKVPHFIIFRIWFASEHPNICSFPDISKNRINTVMKKHNYTKAEYFSAMLSASGDLK